MNTAKDKLKKDIQYEIDVRNRLMKKLDKVPVNLIQQAFPSGVWGTSWGYNFDFTLQFDFELIRQVREFMEIQFPDFEQSYEHRVVWDESKEAGHFLEYSNEEGTEIKFCFRTGRDGTTCVLNPIGEKQVTVYEVVCSEGANEKI